MRRKLFSNIYKSLLGSVMLAVLAISCTTEDFNTPPVNEADAVVLTAGSALSMDSEMGTRATNDTWDANDQIGVTMLSTSTPSTPIYTNRQYNSIAAGSGSVKFNPEAGNEMYYPIDGSEVTFKAYYPYTGVVSLTEYSLDVSGQSDIANLDLMTAEHKNEDESTVNSKNKKEAHLVFHHRLTLVTVNLLTEDDSPITLDEDTKLVIKGMKTTGNYNLMTDELTTDAGSVQDIIIPLSSTHVGQAILLPREAAAGVEFEVTLSNGGVYTAAMDADLDLNGGSKYIFNLTLKTTPTLLTASIEDWTDGPIKEYDVVHLVTLTGDNEGFADDSQLILYAKDTGEAEYSDKGTFTYDAASDKWESATPIHWENFTGPNIDFKATSIYAGALNTSQIPDYLVGEAPDAALYSGLHMEMKHVGTKVTVKLSSSDGTYSSGDLDGAEVTLPGYLNEGSLDEDTGAFIIGSGRGDITPEKQGDATPKERVAIFPPQTITAGNTLTRVVINGHTYNVTDASDFEFEAGKHHEIRLNIQKSGVELTAKVIDWAPGPNVETEVRIGTPSLGDNENIPDGSVLNLFTEEVVDGARSDVPGHFTYNETSDSWTYSDPSNPLFWEDLPDTGRFFASIENDAVNSALANQSKDYIVATPVENNGGVGNTALHFEMRHAVSQVNIVLRSETYDADKLKEAVITLPNYTIGGSLDKGVYVPGSNKGTIALDSPDNDQISTRTYLQAQQIPVGETVARVEIGTRVYDVTYSEPVIYNTGEITNLIINIRESEVLVSVKVTPWQEQTAVLLTYSFDEGDTEVSGFEENDKITFYRFDSDGNVRESKVYVVTSNTELEPVDGTPWYRDDFVNNDKIVAVYPDGTTTAVPTGSKTFDVDLTDEDKRDPNTRENEIQVADGEIIDKSANVDLEFEHVLSKVTVNIIPGDGFADGEISRGNPVVKLIQFLQKGTVDITDGSVDSMNTPENFTPKSIDPTGDAELSFQALILPQEKGEAGTKTTLVTIELNGITYEAQYEGVFTFEPGKNHVLDITLAKTELKLSATIAPWVDGQSGSITID